jgi:hypothetical protein
VDAGVITSDMISGVTDVLVANLGVVIPVGITILGIMLGVAIIPRIIWKFF